MKKIFIAIPCGDFVPVGFMRSAISMQPCGEMQFVFAQGSLVYDARNKLTNLAIDGGFDRVLWLDSDMEFDTDLLVRLSADLDAGVDMVTGLYFTRKRPIKPVVYSQVGMDKQSGNPYVTEIKNWREDGLFEVAACGFGAVLINVDLLRRVRDKFKLPFSPAYGFGEDLSFCLRVRDLGAKIYCDPSIKVGHIGQMIYNYETYATGNEQ